MIALSDLYDLTQDLLGLGGPGSGNWGHAGRPGKLGGSAPGGGLGKIGASKADSPAQRREKSVATRHGSTTPADTRLTSFSAEFQRMAGEARVTTCQGLNTGVQNSYVVTFDNGDKAIWKPFDPNNGWNHPACAEQEVGGYQISEFFGWDLVPQTEFMSYKGAKGSVQKWIDNATAGIIGDESTNALAIHRTAVLDLMIGNRDRNNGNYIVGPDGRFRAIDQGFGWRDLSKSGVLSDVMYGEESLRALNHSNWAPPSPYKMPPELVRQLKSVKPEDLRAHLLSKKVPDQTATRMANNLRIMQGWNLENLDWKSRD